MESTRLFDHRVLGLTGSQTTYQFPSLEWLYLVPEPGYIILNLTFSMEILCLNQGTQYLIYPFPMEILCLNQGTQYLIYAFQWKSGVYNI